MKRAFRPLSAAVAAVLALASGAALAQKTELLVYTALETDQLKAYTESFQKTNPNIDLKFVRDSTGVITAKILAEKANPQADVILGVAASSMEIFKAEGMLAPYAPVGFDKLDPRYSDTSPRHLGRPGRVRGGRLLQHRRGTEEGHPRSPRRGPTSRSRLQGADHRCQPGFQRNRLLRRERWLQTMGEPAAGSTWTRCTRTSRSTRTRARSRAARRARASSWSASRSTSAATTSSRRARRGPRLPEGRPGLRHRGLGHREDDEEDGRGEEAHGLGRDQGGERGLREEFRLVAHPT
jgi:hypothetical protein